MSLKSGLFVALMSMLGLVMVIKAAAPDPIQLMISAPEGPQDGSSVELTATLTNKSEHDVTILQIRGDFSGYYTLNVLNVQHNRVEQQREVERDSGLLSSLSGITLKPGEHTQETIELGRMYDLTEPGTYVIQAERSVREFKGIAISHLTSNQIKVEIAAHP